MTRLLTIAAAVTLMGCSVDRASIVADSASGDRYRLPGGGGVVTLLLSSENASFALLEMEPGAAVPEHVHDASDEIVYTLEGSGVVTLDGIDHELSAGTAVCVPAGVRHAFRAGTKWRGVQVYSPPGPEQRFRAGERLGPVQ